MKKLLAPIAVAALLQPDDTQAQLLDTLCNASARLWVMNQSNILEFQLNGSTPVLTDTLIAFDDEYSLAYTGVFGLPTFAGAVWNQGTHIWDGANWTQWPGLSLVCGHHAGDLSNLYYWVSTIGQIVRFDGSTEQSIWSMPAGYVMDVPDLAVDSVGNVYAVISNGNGAELRCISPQGVELATWNIPIPTNAGGLAIVGNVLYYTYVSNIGSIVLDTPPNATLGPLTSFFISLFWNMANCPTADISLTDLARSAHPGTLGIHPNPAQEEFQVVLPAAFDGTTASITIVDGQGRTVWTGSAARAKVMVNAALEPGHYSVVADNGRARSTAGLAVVR